MKKKTRSAKNYSVKCWLKKLEATTYDKDDILDEWNYTLFKYKMKEEVVQSEQKADCSFNPSPSCMWFKKVSYRRDISKKIMNVSKPLLMTFSRRMMALNLSISLPESAATHDSCKVHGDIDRNKNDIVAKLMVVICISYL